MYILKNAWRNVTRSKGRSILIGVIIFLLIFASCLGLSIRQAAETAKEEGLKQLSITGQITMDMDEIMGSNSGNPPDKSEMKENLKSMEILSLAQLKKYAKADAVSGFYYTLSESADGSGLESVTSSDNGGPKGGFPGGQMDNQSSGDFTLVGYSSDDAMSEFKSGSMEISKGEMFEAGTKDSLCVISEELATLNDLEVGDKIKLVNPEDTDKTVELKITGTFTGGMGKSNEIMTSYSALAKLNKTLDMEGSVSGTYEFDSVDDYEAFEKQAEALGMDEKYTVISQDINQFENSLQPLKNLSKFAMIFLAIILVIGIAILVVINLISIRDRKYEVGVLTAMGMNKKNVAMQFVCETLMIALVAIIMGTSLAGISSKPIANSLLSSQITQSQEQQMQGFGRPGGVEKENINDKNLPKNNTVTEVDSTIDFSVIAEVCLIGLFLSLISSGGAVMYITRYNPLQILSDRD